MAVALILILALILIGVVLYVIIRYKRGEIGPGAVNTGTGEFDDFDDDFDTDGDKTLTYAGSDKDGGNV